MDDNDEEELMSPVAVVAFPAVVPVIVRDELISLMAWWSVLVVGELMSLSSSVIAVKEARVERSLGEDACWEQL